ncbi:hypothetical protein GGH15_004041 [Coemansia sp. RSA 562]|nr:hypothetical protein GGH15_004041 [Coemansia sp. RSA 562]
MPGGSVVKQPKKYVRRLTPLPGMASFISKPVAPDTNGDPVTAEVLNPSDVDEDDDNLPIESRRPLPLASHAEHAAEQILPATQKHDVPNFSVLSQNIYGAKLGVAAYRTAEEKRNGGKRFRESDERTAKLDELRMALNKRNIMSDSRHDFVFLQELNTAISPEELLDRFPEYTIFAGTPRGSGRFYDTAVLVSTRFGLAQLEEMASCTRATFVTVPDFGLLLVSVHGPFENIRAFHHDIISTVMLYQQAGWTPIVAGDFNLAPTPADCHGVAKRRGMTDSRGMAKRPEEGLMHLYTESLGLCNACEVLNGLANPRSTINRSIYYTFKWRGETGTPYVSRIDHILIPPHLLDIKRAKYDHIDVGSFSDHKELTLYAPQPLLGEFFSDASYEMAHDFPSDPVHLAKIEQILGGFDFTLTGRAAFERYRELLSDVLQYSRKQSDLQKNRLENKILWLREERMRLGNEQDGLGWVIHEDKIRSYEEQAVALAQKASLKVQEKTASVWLNDGDRNPVWQSLITRRCIDPRRQQAIFALQHISPTGFSAANSDSENTRSSSAHSLNPTQSSCIAGDTNEILRSTAADLHTAAEYYFGRAFEHEEPCQPSMETLCESMLSDIDTRGCALTGAEIHAMPQTFEIIDILAACKKAALLDAAGPNGVPSKLYIHSQTAQKILHHLGNIWIRDPDSVPAS